jgi:hypothetical protein
MWLSVEHLLKRYTVPLDLHLLRGGVEKRDGNAR